jgi:Domain of unknown function (DUF4159)
MRRQLLTLAFALLIATGLVAQGRFQRGWRREPPKFATPDSFDGGFNFCRLMYDSVRREEGGVGWSTDYPNADTNFSIRLSELTKTRVSRLPDGEPNHLVVRAADEALFQCPFVQMSDAGTAGFGDEEVAALRAYLMKGGFLWADDFWGDEAWRHFTAEIARVLPSDRYPVVQLTPEHPAFRTMFEMRRLPQIPSIRVWGPTRQTSERGAASATVHFGAVLDPKGRIMVLMTHNTDIADAWEREGDDASYFYAFSPDGYAIGINFILYNLTH